MMPKPELGLSHFIQGLCSLISRVPVKHCLFSLLHVPPEHYTCLIDQNTAPCSFVCLHENSLQPAHRINSKIIGLLSQR